MTTSISSVAVNPSLEVSGESAAAPVEVVTRVPHTLASRFIFLGLCMAIVLTALAFGNTAEGRAGLGVAAIGIAAVGVAALRPAAVQVAGLGEAAVGVVVGEGL